MNDYMEKEEIMRAKTQKVLKERQFSKVDAELDYIHEDIMKNSDLRVIEGIYDSRTLPFRSIQHEIKSKGKSLQRLSSKLIASRLVKPDPMIESKETQTAVPDPLEEKVGSLKMINDELEDKLRIKEQEVENMEYSINKYIKENNNLKDIQKSFKEKEAKYLHKLEEQEFALSRKAKGTEELSQEILELQKEMQEKDKKLANAQFDMRYALSRKDDMIQDLHKNIGKLHSDLDLKKSYIKRLEKEIEYLSKINEKDEFDYQSKNFYCTFHLICFIYRN